MDQLRDRVRNQELDRLLLTAPDRLARNYVHQMLLIEELEQGGCQVEFVDRPMSRDPNDQLLLQIRGAVAEYERTLIAERTRRGRLAKLRAGSLLPWTYAPYGYRLHPERPRDPSGVTCDSAEAALVAELFARYLEPQSSLDSVCKQLNRSQVPTPRGGRIWSPSTLRGILSNPVYTGHVYAGRVRYRPPRTRRSATHPLGQPHGTATALPAETWIHVADIPAIVSQEQFDLVQRKLATNQSFARRNNTAHEYLLRALVSCGRCQLACIARTVHDRYHYYLCNGKANPERSRREDKCLSRFIPAEQLDDLVWQDLCTVLTHPEFIEEALQRLRDGAWLPQELQMRRANLRKGQASLDHQIERLTDAYLHAVIPLAEYERRRHELEQKLQALIEHERAFAAQADRQQELAGLASSMEAFCQRVQQGLAQATFEQKRELVLLLIDRVIVTDGDVEIRYVIPTSPASEHVRFCHLRTDYVHYPAPGQEHEAALGGWQLDDFQPHAVALGRSRRLVARVALVHEGYLDRVAGDLLNLGGQHLNLRPLLLIGGRDKSSQQLPQRINGQMHLRALPLLVPIVARPGSAFGCGLHRPGIKDRRRGLRVAPSQLPQQQAQVVHHLFEDPGLEPALGLLVDGVPRRQVVGHKAPLAAAAHDVAQTIEDLPQGVIPLRRRLPSSVSGKGRRTPIHHHLRHSDKLYVPCLKLIRAVKSALKVHNRL